MADNFLQAINTGINLGHMADSAKMQRAQMERMAEEMTLRRNAQMLEMAKYNQGVKQQEGRQSMYAPESFQYNPNAEEGAGYGTMAMGPGRAALKDLYPQNYGPMADALLYGDHETAKLFKPEKPAQDQFKVVGGNLIDTTKDPTKPVFTAPTPEKAKSIRQIDLGDKVEIYEDGVLARTVPKGKTPGSEASGKVQQSVFTDPADGTPLVFDPKTQTYKRATLEGSGAVAPRPVNPSAGEREKTASFSVLRDQLKRIKEAYQPRYVGLVSGQMGRVTQWTDENEAAFRQIVLDVKDSLLRARSGAQINEQEYARLAKLVPDFTDSEPQFAGKMKSFEATFEAIARERERAQKGGGVYLRGTPARVGRFTVEAE